MNTLERVDQWKQDGVITAEQHLVLTALLRRERFSVFLELNALLYIGVLAVAAGLAATIQQYFADLSDAAILLTLTGLLAWSLYYCFSRALPYSNAAVESPSLVFDYVLYFGCLVLSVELGYLAYRFEFFKDSPDVYFLLSAFVFFVFAYRFDNRFVLSLALSALASALGLRTTRFGLLSPGALRAAGIGYGAFVASLGFILSRNGLKKHFLETYLHIAVNAVFLTMYYGLVEPLSWELYLAALIMLSTVAVVLGIRYRRFAFVVYGTIYGYAGISYRVVRSEGLGDSGVLTYFVITGVAMIAGILILARRIGQET
jgi:hypothetical protein